MADETTLDFSQWFGGGNAQPAVLPADPNSTTIQFPWYVPGFEVPPELRDTGGPNPGGPIRQTQPPAQAKTIGQWIDANTTMLAVGGGLLFLALAMGGRKR